MSRCSALLPFFLAAVFAHAEHPLIYESPARFADEVAEVAFAGDESASPESEVRSQQMVVDRSTLIRTLVGFPQEFLDGLVAEERNGYVSYPISVRIDPTSGCVLFENAAGRVFYAIAPVAGNPVAPAIPAGNVLVKWRVLPEDFNTGTPRLRTSDSGLRTLASDTLRLSSIACFTNGVSLSAAWPASDAPTNGVLDLYFSTHLDRDWRVLKTMTIPAGATNLATFLAIDDIPSYTNRPPAHVHAADCHIVTNISPNIFSGGAVVTNIHWSCAGQRIPPYEGDSGFFRLGTRDDTDGDGLPDAYERIVSGTSETSADTDGDTMPDGYELVCGFNPKDFNDSILDADHDGIPNVYEYHNGTNPLMEDYVNAPKIVVGGEETNSVPTLTDAFAASMPYSILEISPGIHSGEGWEGVEFPDHPVLVTSSQGGRNRGTVLRSTGIWSQTALLLVNKGQNEHTVVQGLTLDLATPCLAGIWCGSGTVYSGPPSGGYFRNIYMRLGSAASQNNGWYCVRASESNRLVFANCVIDASRSTWARGIVGNDPSNMVLENCTFFGFPELNGDVSYALHLIGSSRNFGGAANPVPVHLRNCLFDASFTNALVLAETPGLVSFSPMLERCLFPAVHLSEPHVDCIATNALLDAWGHLPFSNPANAAGLPVTYSDIDLDGSPRGGTVSIGADEWSDGTNEDSDDDNLSNSEEIGLWGTNPFLFDTDGDGVGDGLEAAHGANPLDPQSYCFNLCIDAPWSPCVHPDARLAVASMSNGTWSVLGPSLLASAATNGVYGFGHILSPGPDEPHLVFFLDSNADVLPDMDEVRCSTPLSAGSHDGGVSTGAAMDRDRDGIPDLWELVHGLCPTNALDAVENPDGDGLVNLHEYWAGCDPWTVDGTNTLLSAIATSIDSLIAGVTNAEAAKPMYRNYIANGNAGIFERNTNCWAHGIDLSCAAVWRTSGNPRYHHLATLISPRHAIGAKHAASAVGDSFVFQSADGLVVTNRISAEASIAENDIIVYLLENEMPTNFPPAKILPSVSTNFIGTGKYLPVLANDQEGKALVWDILSVDTDHPDYGKRCIFSEPLNTDRASLYEDLKIGDSARPVFVFINSDPVLLCTWWHGAGTGPSISYYSDDVQEIMDTLATGYQLEFVDMSPFLAIVP